MRLFVKLLGGLRRFRLFGLGFWGLGFGVYGFRGFWFRVFGLGLRV